MANSRIMLVCKHCGGELVLGKGYFGEYYTVSENKSVELNEFFDQHRRGRCSGDIDCSDNARNHFVLLEEGETLATLEEEANKAKAGAIKGFAKRLNKEAEKVCIDREGDFVEADGEIYDTVADWCKKTSDNIVKEMVGEDNA
jgi:hypothetical protein